MTAPASCSTCGLAPHVHRCTAERCGNPICVCGHQRHAGQCRECGCGEFAAKPIERGFVPVGAAVGVVSAREAIVTKPSGMLPPGLTKPPSDLDTFRAMLERAGVRFESWTTKNVFRICPHAGRDPGDTDFIFERAGKLTAVIDRLTAIEE